MIWTDEGWLSIYDQFVVTFGALRSAPYFHGALRSRFVFFKKTVKYGLYGMDLRFDKGHENEETSCNDFERHCWSLEENLVENTNIYAGALRALERSGPWSAPGLRSGSSGRRPKDQRTRSKSLQLVSSFSTSLLKRKTVPYKS